MAKKFKKLKRMFNLISYRSLKLGYGYRFSLFFDLMYTKNRVQNVNIFLTPIGDIWRQFTSTILILTTFIPTPL